MKRFTLLTMLFALLSVTAFAQKGMDQRLVKGTIQRPGSMLEVKGNVRHSLSEVNPIRRVASTAKLAAPTTANVKKQRQSSILNSMSKMKAKAKGVSRKSQSAVKAPKRAATSDVLVAPPSTATVETWYTADGAFFVGIGNGYQDYISYMKTVNVAIDGNDLYIQGLAIFFEDAWIKGTINGDQVIFENGQFVGEDEYGAEYLVGSDDGQTASDYIVFNYDAEQGVLKAVTLLIIENEYKDELSPWAYWVIPTFTKEKPATDDAETWYTITGRFSINTGNSYEDYTSDMQTVNVAINGNDIYIQGLAYFFENAWIKGTIVGNEAIFENGQFLGEDDYGPEYLVGSDDGQTLSDYIVFNYDAEQGILEAVTPFITESASNNSLYIYSYWLLPTFSKSLPDLVEVPAGLVTEEYFFSYVDYQGETVNTFVNVGFDGNDVYIQGISGYVPEAWVKGALNGTTITFPGNQFLGIFNGYMMYLQEEDVVFNFDANASKMTATDAFSVFTGSWLEADSYEDAVICKVIEMAGIPATPKITEIYQSTYGPIVYFNVPIVDVDGNPMISSKLSFQFFSEVNHVANPVTFDPEDYIELTEAMTVIPYGFSENYDFYPDHIYLNMDFSSWNKIGIQSTYTGEGEENKSEIFWFTLKEYEYALGDVNHDGLVNITDVTLTVNYILTESTEGFFVEQADINGDGGVDITDVTSLVNLILQSE